MVRHHEAEVIIVGGGPAGLSAALYLARYNRSVALFDLGHGRSTHFIVQHRDSSGGQPGGERLVDLVDVAIGEERHIVREAAHLHGFARRGVRVAGHDDLLAP